VAQTGPVLYKVKLDLGMIWRHHVDQLQKRHKETDSDVEAREDARHEDILIPIVMSQLIMQLHNQSHP